MFQGQSGYQIRAPGMPYGMDVAQIESFKKTVSVLNHGRHRVIGIRFRIVGMALANLVYGINVEPLSQPVKVQAPVFSAIGRVVGTKMAAMKQYDNRSVTFLEIARSYAVYVDEFFSGHACAFGLENL
jgi:hypothetical protein